VALYAAQKGELDQEVPSLTSFPSGVVKIPLRSFGMGTTVTASGYFLAYVTGASDWGYVPVDRSFRFELNRFDDYRTYWLVNQSGGPVMGDYACRTAPSDSATTFGNRLYVKRSFLIPHDDREGTFDWVWARVTPGGSGFHFRSDRLIGLADSTGILTVSGSSDPERINEAFYSWGTLLCDGSCRAYDKYTVSLSGDMLDFGAQFTGTSSQTNPGFEIEHLQLEYRQKLDMTNLDKLTIFSSCTSGIVKYVLSGVPQGKLTYLLRVPVDEGAITLLDTLRGERTPTYSWVDTAAIGVKYFACTNAGATPTPTYDAVASTGSTYSIADLRDVNNKADYLVVYHPDFRDQAERLVRHKEQIRRFARPRMVDITDIYRDGDG
jgi:hypothetical protein